MDVSSLLFATAMLAQNDVPPPATLPAAQPAQSGAEPAPIAIGEQPDYFSERYGPAKLPAAQPTENGVQPAENGTEPAPISVGEQPDYFGDRYEPATTSAAPADVPGAGQLVPVVPAVATSPPTLFLRHATLPSDVQLDGQPVALADVLSPRLSAAQRIAAAETYWQLAGEVAEYCLCNEEIEQLEQWAMTATLSAADQVALEARLTAALAATQQCRVDVLTTQQALIRAGGMATAARRPLPGDAPHVGGYQTRVDAIFPAGAVPREMKFAADLLPAHNRAIALRAAAVDAAGEARRTMHQQFTAGAAPFSALLASHDLWANQHRALLSAIVDYNRAIAAYALPLAPPGTASERLVAMLIKQARAQPAAALAQNAAVAKQPSRAVDQATLIVPANPVIVPSPDPLTATSDALTPAPNPLIPTPAGQPRQPLPRIDRPADLPPRGTPPPRGEPTLAPPLESEPLTDEADGPIAPSGGQPTPADPVPAEGAPSSGASTGGDGQEQ